MRWKDIVGLIIAIILAVAVVFLTRFFLVGSEDKKGGEKEVAKVHTETIIIASKELKKGHNIKAGDLRLQPWPNNALHPNYLTSKEARLEDFIGGIVRQPMSQGEPLTQEDVVKPGEKGALAAMITPGKRAISISVNAASVSSGLIVPGDTVDVILSKSNVDRRTGATLNKSETLLENIKVLAIDKNLQESEEKKKAIPKTATLEVTQQQAEIIKEAEKQGNISLSLHSLGSEEARSVFVGKINGKYKKPATKVVTVIRGSKRQDITLQGD